MQYTRVYSPSGALLGFLTNAKVSYTLKLEPLSTAKIILPTDDPANELCQMFNEVEIYDDGGDRVDLFRIIGQDAVYKSAGSTVTYNCEHVLATLIDTVIPGYLEIGGTDMSISDCAEQLLARQNTARWTLGTCAFETFFQYSFENETLLRAILTLPKQLTDGYRWVCDTTVRPHTISLLQAETTPTCEVRYARNMREVKKTIDVTGLCTRLYPYGAGEGVNKVTISDVNDSVEYIESDTIDIWGVKELVWTDVRLEDPQSLYNRALAVLEESKNPYICYKVSAVDLYQLTGEPMDSYMPGKLVRIVDNEHDIALNAIITEKLKKDIFGAPGDVDLTLANKAQTVADTIADLRSRAAINELYAQGATNIITESIADNADADHPIERTVYIPRECARVNKLRLRLALKPFRAYSKSARASTASVISSEEGGMTSATSPQQVQTNDIIVGGPRNTSGGSISNTGSSSATSTGAASDGYTGYTAVTGIGETHHHTISHSHSMPTHSHGMNHYHTGVLSITIPAINIDLPAHSHTVRVPSHTHNINFGIYEGTIASGYTVAVDGNDVPATAFEEGVADIIPYLACDDGGKILRDYDHTITITPVAGNGNADGLTRIEGQLVMQVFIRSQGGGDY